MKKLSTILGKDNVRVSKNRVTDITGTIDDLEEAARCLLVAVGLKEEEQGGSDLTERCLHIDNIPYMTDDVGQLTEELGVHLRRHGGELQEIVCPIIGRMTRAIAVFKSVKGICQQFHVSNRYYNYLSYEGCSKCSWPDQEGEEMQGSFYE